MGPVKAELLRLLAQKKCFNYSSSSSRGGKGTMLEIRKFSSLIFGFNKHLQLPLIQALLEIKTPLYHIPPSLTPLPSFPPSFPTPTKTKLSPI